MYRLWFDDKLLSYNRRSHLFLLWLFILVVIKLKLPNGPLIVVILFCLFLTPERPLRVLYVVVLSEGRLSLPAIFHLLLRQSLINPVLRPGPCLIHQLPGPTG